MSLIQDAKGYHDLGLALIHLREKSKAPLGAGWTKGPRISWSTFKAAYRPGQNIGVRLGAASVVYGGHLAVIDCDVKSTDKKHLAEMNAKLVALFPDLDVKAPRVTSGRGNGSRHIYGKTEKPVTPRRLAQSGDHVRVYMPSVNATPREVASLPAADIAKGWRLRPAWEISLMGEGQQVVLPPSIHPDSGKPYLWSVPLNGSLPALTLPTVLVDLPKAFAAAKGMAATAFTLDEVDLYLSDLPTDVATLIVDGDGCEDRSASLFKAAHAMVKAGFTNDQILTVLTDRSNYLGQAAYAHTQSDSRERAAAWVSKYTLAKSRTENDPAYVFRDLVIEDDKPAPLPLAPAKAKAAKAAADELTSKDDCDWRDGLTRTQSKDGPGAIKNTLKNVQLILVNDVAPNVFRFNDFAQNDYYGVTAPWGTPEGSAVRDIDTIRIKFWLSTKWRFEPSNNIIEEAVRKIADLNRFHPVRDQLDALSWDGVPRVDTWLKDYLGATGPEPYLSDVSRKVLAAMVARVYSPGCKFDYVLILEGKQGYRKSTAIRTLCGDAWFNDTAFDINDKDAVMGMQNVWVVEIGELSTMRRAEVDTLKAFVSRQTDRIRAPYGARTEEFPRQCVFIGSTNGEEYLTDPTGNRRFWPVSVSECDIEGLRLVRDQLFAEARLLYELGEPLYLENRESESLASDEQDARNFQDEWVGIIGLYLAKRTGEKPLMVSELFSDPACLPMTQNDRRNQMRAAATLRALGYNRVKRRVDGLPLWTWEAPVAYLR